MRHAAQRDEQRGEGVGQPRIAPIDDAIPGVGHHDVAIVQVVVLDGGADAGCLQLGARVAKPRLEVSQLLPNRSTKYECEVGIDELTRAWRGTLDW